MSNETTVAADRLAMSMQRIVAAGATAAHGKETRAALVEDARHVERGLVSLIRQALDAGKLDADDAATMLPLVRKVIEGNHS